MAIIEFDRIYSELLCEDAPITDESNDMIDPWDGVKPHAEGGFMRKYCSAKGVEVTYGTI